mmetsp:Transcript_15099/g.20502  ORF Transcript_15099/g.20502 Transcript_15099/m.20502 type:complete len:134 (-) Transcript_15099:1601-2002(-)
MLAFRPYDTNGATQQTFLGLSPPSKKSAMTPSKDPIDKNMLYKPCSPEKTSGFKFDLQSVACRDQKASSSRAILASPSAKANANWQADLTARISSFETTYTERKAALLKQLASEGSESVRTQLVDSFVNQMED